jgi:hypothetical protein
MSSFTDDELAKIWLDRSGEFSDELSVHAEATLNARLKVSLEPYEKAVKIGDRRGQATAINALYDQMSDDTRAALRWTPVMMVSNNSMLGGDTEKAGPIEMATIFANLQAAFNNGGLSYNGNQA